MNAFTATWLTPKRLLTASVVVALITIVLKTLAWWVTDSVGLLSDAMESVVNLASAMFGLLMVTRSPECALLGHGPDQRGWLLDTYLRGLRP